LPVIASALAAASLFAGAPAPAFAHPHIWVSTRTEVVVENGAIVALRHAWTFDEYYSATAVDGLDTNKDGTYSREELAELAKINVEALKEFGYFTFPRLAGKDLALGKPKDFWLSHVLRPPAKASDDKTKTAVGTTGAPAATGASPPSPSATASAAPGAASPLPGPNGVPPVSDKPADELTLHVTIPLATPVLLDAKGFTFSIGDPTFFIAFEPVEKDPVTLAGAPAGCRIAAVDAKPEPANPGKPGDLMAPQPAAPADGLNVRFVTAAEWTVACGG
jgi:ABC-type uncharacterized transport system substrate-binding protein